MSLVGSSLVGSSLVVSSAVLMVGCGGSESEPVASEPAVPELPARQPAAPESGANHATAGTTVAGTTGAGPIATESAVSATTVDTPSAVSSWRDEEVQFSFDGDELFGVLTLPPEPDPDAALIPAIVLVSGSGDEFGIRSGATTRTFVDHAHQLAGEGFAVLRYDPPGVGRSGGSRGFPSLEQRVDETLAAMRFVASRSEIDPDAVGLLGWSQGPWVMAMTAARYPDEVAFLVSVAGSGQTVEQQQVYGIESQTRAAGLAEDDVAKAVVFGRLMIDWQLIEPIYRDDNEAAMAELGDGPWATMAELVYDEGDVGPVASVPLVIEILTEVQDEPWASELVLRELYIPQLESLPNDITVDQLAAVRAQTDALLRTDPADFLTEVRVPVLAIFGEHDLNVDSSKSPRLFEQYLAEAGNDDATIVVVPDVGHGIGLPTPGYWTLLSDWLRTRFGE